MFEVTSLTDLNNFIDPVRLDSDLTFKIGKKNLLV